MICASASLTLSCSKVEQLAESVSVQGLAFATNRLVPAITNRSYLGNITASGGQHPYSYSVQSGALPTGIVMNAAGELSGTPTTLGTALFSVRVTDSKGISVSQDFTLKVSAAITILTPSLPLATVNTPYAQGISVTGGSGSYTFTATGLPPGYLIDQSLGWISGNASTPYDGAVIIVVRDSEGLQESRTFPFSVTSLPEITTSSLPSAALGAPYSVTLNATGGKAPRSFEMASGDLPEGLALASDGTISGTPKFGANVRNSPFAVTIRVKDALNQTATRVFTMSASLGPKLVDDKHRLLRPAAIGVPYLDFSEVRGGKGALTYSASGLPNGLTINPVSGFISGTPAAGGAGTYHASITVTDAQNLSHTISKVINVRTSGLSTPGFSAPIQVPVGVYNAQYSYVFDQDVADINGDGHADIVAGGYDSRGILVMLGNGNGSFTKIFHANASVTRTRWVRIIDLDGDGKKDVVTVSADGAVDFFKGDNNWTGTVTKQAALTGQGDLYGFDFGDFNGDGKIDIALSRYAATTDVAVLLNCTNAATVAYNGLTPACSNTGGSLINFHNLGWAFSPTYSRDLVVDDFNGDGKADIIASSYNNSRITIYPGVGNGTFLAGQVFTVGTFNPRGIVKGDMDGDGITDYVLTGNLAISVMLNNGDGTFKDVRVFSIDDTNVDSENLDIGDIDGDGDLDIVYTAEAAHTSAVGIFFNDGSGNLYGRKTYTVGYSARAPKLAKVLDSSTRPDLVFASSFWVSLSRVLIYPNNGTSNPYHSGDHFLINPPANYSAIFGAPVVGDINNDGFLDIITKIGGAASTSFGSAAGTFSVSPVTFPTGDTSAVWYLGKQNLLTDLNGDGNLDYVSANWNGGGSGTVTVMIGNGDGTWGSQFSFAPNQSGCTLNGGARGIDSADFNRDGKMDLVIATGCGTAPGSQTYIYFGNGDGSFDTTSPRVLTGEGSYANLPKSMDLDGDGKIDLVVAHENAWIQVFKGRGDGSFDPPQRANLLTSATPSSIDIAEVNGDGTFDILVSTYGGPTMSVIMMGPGAVLGAPQTVTGVTGEYANQRTPAAAFVDWDLDGKIDIVSVRSFYNSLNTAGGGGIHFLKGNGLGNFLNPTLIWSQSAFGPYSDVNLTIADINGDGKPDLITGNAYTAAGSGIGINLNDSR